MADKKIKILLIDDDADYSRIVRQLLSPYQTYTFELLQMDRAEKALDLLRTSPDIDLILMDYYMPQLNGLQITETIKNEHIDLPIIFLTSHKDYRAVVDAMKQGAEDYLLKEDLRDSILPRTVIHTLDKWHLKRKIAEAQKQALLLEKKTEAIKELVVTMCHEFNNPLAAIKISTAILGRQKELKPKEKTLLDDFNSNVAKLEEQITKLRDLNFE
jgi:DNA-binding NtrC family response regulator